VEFSEVLASSEGLRRFCNSIQLKTKSKLYGQTPITELSTNLFGWSPARRLLCPQAAPQTTDRALVISGSPSGSSTLVGPLFLPAYHEKLCTQCKADWEIDANSRVESGTQPCGDHKSADETSRVGTTVPCACSRVGL
jgi:hypothetical protein